MNNSTFITIVLVVVVGAGAFFGGMKYQQSKQSSFSRQAGQTQGVRTGQGQGNRQGFRPITGDIIGSDDKSITVKLQDGSSKIILFSSNTTINKADTATKDDLKSGTTVAIFGQTNSDGSVTAQNIQLNPTLRNGMGGTNNGGSPR